MVIVPSGRGWTRTNTLLSIFRMELDMKDGEDHENEKRKGKRREEALLTRGSEGRRLGAVASLFK